MGVRLTAKTPQSNAPRSDEQRNGDDANRSSFRTPLALGLLANMPLATFVLLDTWVGWTQKLWIGARDDLLVYGAAGIGPLLGCLAILISRRWRGRRTAGLAIARWACGLSLVSGVVVAYLVRGLAGPWLLLWSPGLLALTLLAVSERDPPL